MFKTKKRKNVNFKHQFYVNSKLGFDIELVKFKFGLVWLGLVRFYSVHLCLVKNLQIFKP